tara:strand:+ start:465 stop:665 length:201 start_codon:yes stop_codon:yes gene_type:complete
MTESQLVLLLSIITLSIVVPMFISYRKKLEQQKLDEKLKESVYVSEKEKIRVYLDQINEKTRSKYR